MNTFWKNEKADQLADGAELIFRIFPIVAKKNIMRWDL